METKRKWARPIPPKQPITCPWCDTQPPMMAGRLSQHVHNKHPLEWKGSIYASLPADFDYGNGPLDPEERDLLIKYSEYSAKAYTANKRKRGPYGAKVTPQERGRRGGLARAANARAEVKTEPQGNNGPVPNYPYRPDRTVNLCPHCGWNINAMTKAQAFVDGRVNE